MALEGKRWVIEVALDNSCSLYHKQLNTYNFFIVIMSHPPCTFHPYKTRLEKKVYGY